MVVVVGAVVRVVGTEAVVVVVVVVVVVIVVVSIGMSISISITISIGSRLWRSKKHTSSSRQGACSSPTIFRRASPLRRRICLGMFWV